MIPRRHFLLSIPLSIPLTNCATLPPDTTRRAGGVADPSAPGAPTWRPDAEAAAAPERPAASPIPAVGQYTCPMHPEVMQGAPGACPKCGMPLIRKEGGGGK